MATVILDATRTAIGSFGGSLKDIPAADLGAHCIKTLVNRNGIDGATVDDVIMGMVLTAGAGQIPSRQALIRGGLPETTPSLTINKVCASGLRAVTLADLMIQGTDAELIIAGGMESMSRAPYASLGARWGLRMGNSEMTDLMIHDGLWCSFENVHMANHGQTISNEYGLSREACDEFAAMSQQRAQAAQEAGRLAEEITGFPIPQRKGEPVIFDKDEQPRPGTTAEGLAALKPVLGTQIITAGNAPSVNDGACALLLASEERAGALGAKPLAYIRGEAHVAMKPYQFPVAPAYAVEKLLDQQNISLSDIALIECNEAFAAVALACGKVLNWDLEKVNVNGGAVAFGHPIGMSGARIITTLAYELRRRGGGLGIACICSGSGQGDAVLIEVPA
ncbi:acetyl-CoA C-acetyltransferase [bacterium]|nr:acetyl-CoA C-acetyltransferase [bacterium]